MSLDRQRRLFDACLDAKSSEERERLLDSCTDPDLRNEVRELLRIHAEASTPATSHFQAPAFPRLSEPHQIGPYRVLERIGEGAMGEVFLAQQQEPVRRRVALKILKFGLATREVIARFELERQTLAVLTHPSIARIFDAGTTPDGRPYFAMEYVAGVPITRYCDERRLGLEPRLALFAQVCAGVQHAHLRGVIHRDLKPSNILVAELDGAPVPKIIDFGIAKATTATAGDADPYTRVGHLLGTPEYMSPEQAQLSPLEVDARTDVYSLGIVLYQLLTGSRPYSVTSDALNPAVVLNEIVTREARPPSAVVEEATPESVTRAAERGFTPAALAARLRGELDWIVLKAIEKDRRRRYDSPAGLSADLERYASDQPVLAGPPSTPYRVRKFVRRHRLGVGAAGAIFAAVLVFGSAMAWFARQAADERDRANREAEAARSVTGFLASMFRDADPYGAAGRTMSANELLREALAGLRDRFVERPDVRVELLETLGSSLASLGDLSEAESALRQALAESTRHYGAKDLHSLRIRVLLTDLLSSRRDNAALRREVEELLPRVRQAADSNPELLVRVLTNQANLEFLEGRPGEAEAPAREALDIAARKLGAHHPLTVAVSSLLAESYVYDTDRIDEMLAETERALKLALDANGGRADHPVVIRMREVRGRALAVAGRFREAVAEMRAALAGAQQALGESSLEAAMAMANMAPYERRLGELDTSLEHNNIAFAILEPHIERRSADYAYLLTTRGATLIAARRPAEALEDLTEAEAIYAELFGPEHWDALTARFYRAVALAYLGRYTEAREAAASAGDPDTPIVNKAFAAHVLGIVDRLAGDAQQAVARQVEAERLIPRNERADWELVRVLPERGLAELDNGDVDAAIMTLTRARDLFEKLEIRPHPPYTEVLAALERAQSAR